jgi:ketosteroid isomerase-like protein
MTTKENKAIVRRYFAASDAADEVGVNALLAPDVAVHYPGAPGPPGPLNREALMQVGKMFWGAFSDSHYTIEDQVAEGDKVATRPTWRATHTGDFQGLPQQASKLQSRASPSRVSRTARSQNTGPALTS